VQFFKQLFSSSSSNSFDQQLRNMLGFKPGKLLLYSTALSHRSVKETAEANNVRKLTMYNKFDNALKGSQIFGNTLEALVGAVYLDQGYAKTHAWVLKQIVIPHMFVDDLEQIDINLKNKLIGWASKNGKLLDFELVEEKMEGTRRLFTIHVTIDGEVIALGKGYNKKDASQVAAQVAVEKLAL